MSYYDYFVNLKGERYDQIKAWGQSGTIYRIGDEVPSLRGDKSYTILMREGYKIRVENCRITSVIDNIDRHVGVHYYDKWGDPFVPGSDGKGHGLVEGEDYFFDHSSSKEYDQ